MTFCSFFVLTKTFLCVTIEIAGGDKNRNL
nr:MAG TPA: hypothetical protein [Caudoviricetes sp.]